MVPAIRTLWSTMQDSAGNTLPEIVRIVHDNVTLHFDNEYIENRASIILNQPLQIKHCNILILALFRSLQSHYNFNFVTKLEDLHLQQVQKIIRDCQMELID